MELFPQQANAFLTWGCITLSRGFTEQRRQLVLETGGPKRRNKTFELTWVWCHAQILLDF